MMPTPPPSTSLEGLHITACARSQPHAVVCALFGDLQGWPYLFIVATAELSPGQELGYTYCHNGDGKSPLGHPILASGSAGAGAPPAGSGRRQLDFRCSTSSVLP